MKRLFFIAGMASLLMVSACNSSSTNNATAEKLPQQLSFTTKEYKAELTPGCDSCPKATVSIPVAGGDIAVAKSINDAVFNIVQTILGEEGKTFNNYDSLLANFINMYKAMRAELPKDAAIGWEGSIKGSIVKQADSLVDIKLEAFTFTGGAHPNTNVYSLLFNPVTGAKLTEADVIKDVPGLTALAEKAFRAQMKIPATAPVNSTVYTFDNNQFVLPRNIFFKESGLQLYYNAYEIAPYYVGATIITLPYADVQPYLSVKL